MVVTLMIFLLLDGNQIISITFEEGQLKRKKQNILQAWSRSGPHHVTGLSKRREPAEAPAIDLSRCRTYSSLHLPLISVVSLPPCFLCLFPLIPVLLDLCFREPLDAESIILPLSDPYLHRSSVHSALLHHDPHWRPTQWLRLLLVSGV